MSTLIAKQYFQILMCVALLWHGAVWTSSGSPPTSNETSALRSASEHKVNAMSSVAQKVLALNESFVVGGLDFSADGTDLATSGAVADPEVHVWTWRQRSQRVLRMLSSAGEGNTIRYSPDGTLLVAGHVGHKTQHGTVQTFRVWNTRTGSVVHDIETTQGGSGFFLNAAFSPDGKFLICVVPGGGFPGDYFVVYSTENWGRLWGLDTLPFIPRRVAVSPSGQFAALSGDRAFLGANGPPIIHRPEIVIVNLETRQIAQTIDMAFPDNNEIQSIAWSPDGMTLAAGAVVQGTYPGPDAVRTFDPSTRAQLLGEQGDTAFVTGLNYSPDGRYLIDGYVDGMVRIWDGAHSQLLQTIPVDDHFHTVVGISRDSRYLAIGAGKVITVWALK